MQERGSSAPGELDELTVCMSEKKLQKLTTEQKRKLREIKRAHDVQWHAQLYEWDGLGNDNDDWFVETVIQQRRRQEAIEDVMDELRRYADPIPVADGFLTGIPHKSNQSNQGLMYDVVRAIHSTKLHYLAKVRRAMDDDPALMINRVLPDMSPASGGTRRLSDQAWQMLKQDWALRDPGDFIKHIVEKHAGEARLVGDPWWEPLEDQCQMAQPPQPLARRIGSPASGTPSS